MTNLNNVLPLSAYPKFLKLLFFVEMWERFSFYGMRALLVLFLSSELGFEDKKSYAIYSLFAALTYAGPVFGGLLADKIFGFRKMVVMGGLVIALGHGVMVLNIFQEDLTFLGLGFIAIGTGLFKGNIANLLGDCYGVNDPDRSRGFILFYVGANIGSFTSVIICGYIGSAYGWHYGFGIAGVGMLLGLALFITYQDILGQAGLPPKPNLVNLKVLPLLSLTNLVFIGAISLSKIVEAIFEQYEVFINILQYFGILMLFVITIITTKANKHDRQNLIILFTYVFFLMCFFGIEMQIGSLINLFTARNVNNLIFGVEIPSAFSQAINPLSVVIFGFILGDMIKINKKYENVKFAFGIATLAIAFFYLYLGCLTPNSTGKVEYIYLLLSMSFIGLGEVCIGPLVLEKATMLSPKYLKGFIMGIVSLSIAFSNLAGIFIAKFMSVPKINGEINYLQSLEIYKTGFLHISITGLLLSIFFLASCYIIKKIKS